MKIKITEKDQNRLIMALRIHWDSRTKQYVGNMIDFLDEIFKQSGYGVFCYHYEGVGFPISITENISRERNDKKPYKIIELEIEEIYDEQLTIVKEDGSLKNIWYGKYSIDSDLMRLIKDRYKYYFKLGLKELEQS